VAGGANDDGEAAAATGNSQPVLIEFRRSGMNDGGPNMATARLNDYTRELVISVLEEPLLLETKPGRSGETCGGGSASHQFLSDGMEMTSKGVDVE